MKCPQCKSNEQFHFCNFCKGKDELDWIENIFGVDFNYIYDEIFKISYQNKFKCNLTNS